ncbi:MAG: DUF7192 family protein [Gemmataceae bacterium]
MFSLTTPASSDSADALWRGAVAIILADLLEACGYRVELWAVNYCTRAYRDGSSAFQAVRLKASESPVDIASLVNGIAGWFYRTVVFQSYYVPTEKVLRTLGHCQTIRDNEPLIQELAGNARILTIDGVWDRDAVRDGSRILSAYRTLQGEKLWIITEAEGDDGRRGSTCILLPEKY